MDRIIRKAGSGNVGSAFRGQARVERYFHPTERSQVTLTGGISEPITTALSPDFTLSEDNGWPNVEGRVAFAFGPLEGEGLEAKRPMEFGISGVVGQIRTTSVATGRGPWRRWIDTALDSPHDIVPWQTAPAISGDSYRAEARSVVMLFTSGKG